MKRNEGYIVTIVCRKKQVLLGEYYIDSVLLLCSQRSVFAVFQLPSLGNPHFVLSHICRYALQTRTQPTMVR